MTSVHFTNARSAGKRRAAAWDARACAVGCVLTTLLAATGCNIPSLNGDGTNPNADGTFVSRMCESSATEIPRERYGVWIPVVLNDVIPGDEQFTCGNGDPYKFFVQYNSSATNLTITFEPGGACWDEQTCRGQAGRLSTVRLQGVPDNFMVDINRKPWAALYPHLGRIDNSVATNYYNHVFFPYCTGDAFTGGWYSEDPSVDEQNHSASYGSLTVKHQGRRNVEAATRWLAETFPSGYVGQLLVAGSSAGSVGATVNYPLLRDTLAPKCGAMIADAGPIFPPRSGQASPQQGILQRVSDAWYLQDPYAVVSQLDTRFGTQPGALVRDHFGNVNGGLARTYPRDRFLFTTYKQDLDFSLFSFVAAGPIPPGNDIAEEVIAVWNAEIDHFQEWIDTERNQNWGYYLPNFRQDWCSHMVATVPFTLAEDPSQQQLGIQGRVNGYQRTEIGDQNFGDILRQMLDPSQLLPRLEQGNYPTQLTYLSEPGVGVNDETWYSNQNGALVEDKQAYIDRQKELCVFTNGYPN